MALLTNKEIRLGLRDLNGWKLQANTIIKIFIFPDFTRAMGFVNSVALCAERVNHHPDIDIRWNKIILSISTHSEGGITKKDISLAKRIETVTG